VQWRLGQKEEEALRTKRWRGLKALSAVLSIEAGYIIESKEESLIRNGSVDDNQAGGQTARGPQAAKR